MLVLPLNMLTFPTESFPDGRIHLHLYSSTFCYIFYLMYYFHCFPFPIFIPVLKYQQPTMPRALKNSQYKKSELEGEMIMNDHLLRLLYFIHYFFLLLLRIGTSFNCIQLIMHNTQYNIVHSSTDCRIYTTQCKQNRSNKLDMNKQKTKGEKSMFLFFSCFPDVSRHRFGIIIIVIIKNNSSGNKRKMVMSSRYVWHKRSTKNWLVHKKEKEIER